MLAQSLEDLGGHKVSQTLYGRLQRLVRLRVGPVIWRAI